MDEKNSKPVKKIKSKTPIPFEYYKMTSTGPYVDLCANLHRGSVNWHSAFESAKGAAELPMTELSLSSRGEKTAVQVRWQFTEQLTLLSELAISSRVRYYKEKVKKACNAKAKEKK